MKPMKKKIVATLMSLVLSVGIVPNVFAAENTTSNDKLLTSTRAAKKAVTALDKTYYIKEGVAKNYEQLISELLPTEARANTSASAIIVNTSASAIFLDGGVTLTNGKLAMDVKNTKTKNGDQATIKITYENALYEISQSTITVIVTDKDILEPKNFSVKDKKFDGKEVEVTEGVFKNILTDEEVKVEPKYIWSTGTPAKEVGAHYVTVTSTSGAAIDVAKAAVATTTGAAVGVVINTNTLYFEISEATDEDGNIVIPYTETQSFSSSSSSSTTSTTTTTTKTQVGIPSTQTSKIIQDAIKANKDASIKFGNEELANFNGKDLLELIDVNKNLILEKDGIKLEVNPATINTWNVGNGSNVQYYLEKVKKSSLDNSLLNKIVGIDKLNEELLNSLYTNKVVVDNKEISGKGVQNKVTVDISKYNLTKDQMAMLTGVYFDKDLKNYVQLGGEVSADGKSFTFYLSVNSTFGVIITDNLLKLKLKIDSSTYELNGKTMNNDVAPIIDNNRTILPLRVIAEAMGAEVSWDNVSRTVLIEKDGKTISVQVDMPLANNYGTAKIINSRTYVPVRYIAEELGSNVVWDANAREVNIYK